MKVSFQDHWSAVEVLQGLLKTYWRLMKLLVKLQWLEVLEHTELENKILTA